MIVLSVLAVAASVHGVFYMHRCTEHASCKKPAMIFSVSVSSPVML